MSFLVDREREIARRDLGVGFWVIFESRNGAFAARRRAFRLHAIRKALIKRRRLVASPPVQTARAVHSPEAILMAAATLALTSNPQGGRMEKNTIQIYNNLYIYILIDTVSLIVCCMCLLFVI